MAQRPENLQKIIPEWYIIEKTLGLQQTKSGRHRIISSWIREGLKYFKLSDKRFFTEDDLLDFLSSKYKEQNKEMGD